MQATTDRSAAIALDILAKIFREDLGRRLAVRLWDGTQVPACSDRAPAFIVNAPYALRAALTPPLDLNPGRAFVSGLIDVEGDIVDAVDVFMRGLGRISNAAAVPLLGQLLRLPKPPAFADRGEAQLRGVAHSRRRDAQAVGFHYDQSLEFYRNFLDEHLVYSCAYFDDGVETLADAQLAKIDHLFRKLRLAPGERLLDIGCGWGALVLRAAAHWGVQATGITLSRSQYEEGRRRIAQANLEDRATIELCDYRDLGGRTFDKIVSVGMFEHVG
ncbi:MAG TPA: cyclopropane-fatty-acyl-phospholipid synthase family protein, partial [Candidatus Acidoferrales bacterium]|nr:cyclopropane-fatty-acyl-phospholipid synthase family protein [Candidatus Acidoferrales bacterium]